MVIAVVVIVLLAAAGGGVWFWQQSGDSGGPGPGLAAEADRELSLLVDDAFPDDWTPDGPEVEYAVGSWVDGRWWTDEHLVREMPDEIVAYDLTDGSVSWRVPVPGSGACLSSREASPDGHVAILRGDGFGGTEEKGCHQLTIVDITSGEEVWTKELPPAGDAFPGPGDRPALANDAVYVPTDAGSLVLRLADGGPAEGKGRDGCRTTALVRADDTLVGWQRCRDEAEDSTVRQLAGFDLDRDLLWAWHVPDQDDLTLTAVLSADPLVVVVDTGSSEQVWRVEPGDGTADDPGEHSVVVEVDAADLLSPCGFADQTKDLSACDWTVYGDGVAIDTESGAISALAALPASGPNTRTGLRRVLENSTLGGSVDWHDGHFAIVSPTVVVTKSGGGGGAGSTATLVYS